VTSGVTEPNGGPTGRRGTTIVGANGGTAGTHGKFDAPWHLPAMTDYYVLDDAGQPVPEPDLLRWGRWFETHEPRVAHDLVVNAWVSTVFLGRDQSLGEGKPVLWETIIVGGHHDRYRDRYTSHADALAGHARAVFMVREASP
jgi:hypothetical protein